MKQYRLVNNIVGWLIFAVAAFTYCSTIEPTASFWDCPEFITTAYKLEVGHPPGAPFFMLMGNFFTLFTDDPSKAAMMVNLMSALFSAGCILFLFWSITHLARKLLCPGGVVDSAAHMVLIVGCGVVGALAYTWSDTFWFSAVEGEVYASSSLFTAVVFWLILKWEEVADQPHSDRWLVLIAYLVGLSIGVHLLNLLCICALVLVYYYRRAEHPTARGSLVALAISVVIIALVLYGIVPGIVKVGGWFELLFVNVLGMSFNTGLIIYIILSAACVVWGVYESYVCRDRRRMMLSFVLSVGLLGIPFFGYSVGSIIVGLLILCAIGWLLMYRREAKSYLVKARFMNTALLCMLMIMIGYSSYAVIVIRSTANPPMDQNSPEDVFTLGSYLNREQYGSKPLLYGQAYTSELEYGDDGYPVRKKGSPIIVRHEKVNPDEPDRYETVGDRGEYKYAQNMFFPRMHDSGHAADYEAWLGGVEGHDVVGTYPNGETYTVKMPTQLENFRFFFSYQLNFMYWRYFMWNFAGRQNDLQGRGELEHGNWLTGISFIDNARLGDQDALPDVLKNNKGHNVFYCLPLILGLLGLFWQAFRGEKGIQQFWVVFFLFFMTGIAIVLYLNQTPNEPRERDYAYAGSFYAFAIWIGLGVAAVARGLERLKVGRMPAAIIASLVCLCVPLQMVSQTWDDHDRSGRYTCRDFGANYLMSLPDSGGPVIFTNGDNDTFPLWYNQDSEGVRTDARVCNLSYLQTDWYIDQMRRPAYDSPSLPITWKRYEYVDNGQHDIFRVLPRYKAELDEMKSVTPGVDPYDLKFILDNFVRNPEIGFFPTDSVVVKVDKEAILRSGMKLPFGKDSIPSVMPIRISKSYVTKAETMMYEMLAQSNWTRPLYISITVGESNHAGLTPYLIQEGLASRITPFNTGGQVIDADRMYDNFMNRFKFGGIDQKGLYLDETVMRMCYTHRNVLSQTAMQLIREGKKDEALKLLEYGKKMIPSYNVPYDPVSVGLSYSDNRFMLPDAWRLAGKPQEAERILLAIGKNCRQYVNWYNTLSDERLRTYATDCYRQYIFLSAVTNGLRDCGSKHAAEYEKFVKGMVDGRIGPMLMMAIQPN